MAAVIDIATGERFPVTVPARPQLRLVHGGASPLATPPVSPRTYLVRRLAVATVALVLVVVLAQGLAAAGRGVAAAFDSAPAASGRVHVVAPGETAWGLAGRYAPSMDRRTAVDELLALNGQDVLRAGQELRLPVSFG